MSATSSCSYFFGGSTLEGQCFGGFRTTSLEGLAELWWMIRHQTSSFAQREFPKAVCWDRCYSICMLRICILLQPDTMSLCERLLMTWHSTVRGRQWSMRDVSKALTSISSELESRGLTVNCEKPVAMVIHPRSSKMSVVTSIDITCGRMTIPLVDSTRMLGVIIDSNLSWKEHVDHVCLKVNRKIGALRRSFRQLCPVARRLFYLSIIQRDFDFGSSSLIPNILISQRKRLVATWRRAVRAVAGSGYQEDVAPLLKELMIDPVEHRWAQYVAVTTFRCRHGTAPPDLRKKLKSVDHGRKTRGASGNYVP